MRPDSGEPRGLSFRLGDLAMDTCRSLGLEVVIQLIGQNASLEYLPDSLIDDEKMIIEGPDVESRIDHWPNLCHPKVLDAVRRYLEEVVPHYRDHPALYAWEIFNEAHFRSYDEFTERSFGEWLGRKYGEIGALNRSWRRRYGSFAQVRLSNIRFSSSAWASLQPEADLYRFFTELTADRCALWKDWLRRLDPRHPVLTDCSHSITLKDPTERCDDDWLVARAGDIFGLSLYPKSWGHAYTPAMFSQSVDAGRAAASDNGKSFLVSELQSHYQSALTPASEVEPEELLYWSWMSVAGGAESVLYWRWRPFLRGNQITGRGLTGIDGGASGRLVAVRRIAETLADWGEDFSRSEMPAAGVGLLYSFESALLARLLRPSLSDLYERNFHGWYAAFWHRNVAVSILRAERLEESGGGIPGRIRLLCLPCCLVVTESLADTLRDFVARGGTLAADARLGISDAANHAHIPVPGLGLDELFGLREENLGQDERGFFRQRLRLSGEAKNRGRHIETRRCYYVPVCAGLELLACGQSGLLDVLRALGFPRRPAKRVVRQRTGGRYIYRFTFGTEGGKAPKVERIPPAG
jgi:beta-galactosidase